MLIFGEFSRHTLIKIYTKTHQTAPHFPNFLGGAGQGRRSMFKHGGDNIVEKYTFRLRDVLRGSKRPVFLGGFGGMPPEKKI